MALFLRPRYPAAAEIKHVKMVCAVVTIIKFFTEMVFGAGYHNPHGYVIFYSLSYTINPPSECHQYLYSCELMPIKMTTVSRFVGPLRDGMRDPGETIP